jgi:hypothetical protein
MLNIQALVLGYEMEKYALFVIMCEFMWRKNKMFELLKKKFFLIHFYFLYIKEIHFL